MNMQLNAGNYTDLNLNSTSSNEGTKNSIKYNKAPSLKNGDSKLKQIIKQKNTDKALSADNKVDDLNINKDKDKSSNTKKYYKQVYRYKELENSDKKSLVNNYS